VLGYLAAGLIVGPYGFAFIEKTEEAERLSEFGFVFLLFTIGLDMPRGDPRGAGARPADGRRRAPRHRRAGRDDRDRARCAAARGGEVNRSPVKLF
jgi:hypothetical protein